MWVFVYACKICWFNIGLLKNLCHTSLRVVTENEWNLINCASLVFTKELICKHFNVKMLRKCAHVEFVTFFCWGMKISGIWIYAKIGLHKWFRNSSLWQLGCSPFIKMIDYIRVRCGYSAYSHIWIEFSYCFIEK